MQFFSKWSYISCDILLFFLLVLSGVPTMGRWRANWHSTKFHRLQLSISAIIVVHRLSGCDGRVGTCDGGIGGCDDRYPSLLITWNYGHRCSSLSVEQSFEKFWACSKLSTDLRDEQRWYYNLVYVISSFEGLI